MKRLKKYMLFLLLAPLIVFCSSCTESAGSARKDSSRITVVATTAIVADLIRSIAGDRAEVSSLMGTGVDPHLYKASAGDVDRLASADMIFYNGLHLEGKITDVLAEMKKNGLFTVAVAEEIDKSLLLSPKEYEGYYDPHVWFDISLWRKAAQAVTKALCEYDSHNTLVYKNNSKSYIKKLDALQEYVQKKIALLPPEKRVLITAHDAFNYFGKGYGFEVIGLQGISTDSEASVSDIKNLSELIAHRKIPAVFVETSISPRYMKALVASVKAKGFEVDLGGTLFSDSMGPSGTDEGTYLGMFRKNVDTIVKSLGGPDIAGSDSKTAGGG